MGLVSLGPWALGPWALCRLFLGPWAPGPLFGPGPRALYFVVPGPFILWFRGGQVLPMVQNRAGQMFVSSRVGATEKVSWTVACASATDYQGSSKEKDVRQEGIWPKKGIPFLAPHGEVRGCEAPSQKAQGGLGAQAPSKKGGSGGAEPSQQKSK